MKSATLPSLRVEPDFRREVEDLLEQGESLSEFVEKAVRATVSMRREQAEFVRRGLASIRETTERANGIPADVVVASLEAKLAAAKRLKSRSHR